MCNLSKQRREKMLGFLRELKEKLCDDETIIALNEIERALTEKKIWTCVGRT